MQLVFVLLVNIDDIPETLALSGFVIIEKAVASNGFLLVHHRRALEHLRLVGFCVEESVRGLDDAFILRNGRWPYNMSRRCGIVVIKRIGGDEPVPVKEFHIIIKDRLTRLRIVFAPVGNKIVFSVHQFSALHKIGVLVKTVIGQTVSIKCLPTMLQHNVLACHQKLVGTTICGNVAGKRERVTLFETHVSERIKGIRLFVKVSTVAP